MNDDMNTPVDPMADQMNSEEVVEETPATPVGEEEEMDAEGETEAEAPVAPVVEDKEVSDDEVVE